MSDFEQMTPEERLVNAMEEAAEIVNGTADPSTYIVHQPSQIDVKGIRKGFGMTQTEFAATFGFKVSAIRDWEQGRYRPVGHTAHYLKVIRERPDAVLSALETAK
ncbi:MAG: helix-turn-helix domain-containing protein [Pseudomonadota bacterium]